MPTRGLLMGALLAASGLARAAAAGPAPEGPAVLAVSIDAIDELRARIPGLTGLRELSIEATCKGDRMPVVPLPDNLGDLRQLEVLRVGTLGRQDCDIRTTLPASLARLQKLRVLEIDDAFEPGYALPAFLGDLRSLEELRLWRCRLEAVPEFVRRLTRLRRLDLHWNAITALPAWLATLPHLEELDLQGNGIHSLPAAFAKARVGTALYRLGNNRLRQSEREAMAKLLPGARLDFASEYDEPEDQEEPRELGEAAAAGLLTWPVATAPERGAACRRRIPAASRTVLGKPLGPGLREEAERLLGPSPLTHQGDASGSLAWRCWEAENGDGTTLLIGHGELDEVVRIFGPAVHFPERGSCPRSKRVHRALATASGLRLGLTRPQVMSIVGKATHESHAWYERACYTRRRMTPQEAADWQAEASPYFAVTSIVRVLEREGRAVGLEIVWAETN